MKIINDQLLLLMYYFVKLYFDNTFKYHALLCEYIDY